MRKLMLLAAMLAMVLAAAAPAFAQATAVEYGDDTDNSVNVSDSICTNVVQIAADQYSAGDQNAASVEGDATNIANQLGIGVNQVNYCLNVYGTDSGGKTVTASAGGGKTVVASAGGGESGGGSASASAASSGGGGSSSGGGGSASATASGTLPETGGASVLALGAGVMLVAGGLVARRIVR